MAPSLLVQLFLLGACLAKASSIAPQITAAPVLAGRQATTFNPYQCYVKCMEVKNASAHKCHQQCRGVANAAVGNATCSFDASGRGVCNGSYMFSTTLANYTSTSTRGPTVTTLSAGNATWTGAGAARATRSTASTMQERGNATAALRLFLALLFAVAFALL